MPQPAAAAPATPPDHAQALAEGRTVHAEALAKRALARRGDDIAAWTTLGRLALLQRRAPAAARAIARLRAAPAGRGAAEWLTGLLERQAGRPAAAAAALREAVAIDPTLADAHHQLSELQREAGDRDAAIASCRAAVAVDARHARAQADLGAMLRDAGRGDEAWPHLLAAVEADPRLLRAWLNIALGHAEAKRWPEAIAAFERCLALEPQRADLCGWLGHARMAFGDAAGARQAYGAALAIDPGFLPARWALAMAQVEPVPGGEPEAAASRVAFGDALDALDAWLRAHPAAPAHEAVAVAQPFHLAYQDEDPRALLARHGALCARAMAGWARQVGLPEPQRLRPPPAGPLRVALVSAHLHDHSVWNAFVRGWVEAIDPARVELHLVVLGGREDAETAFARERAARFRRFGAWAPAALALAADALDAIVYPEVGMHAATTRLAALRLAPLQLAAWGHPVTTGLPTIDHYLGAEAFEAPGSEVQYTERLERLPRLGCTPRRHGIVPPAIDREAAGLRRDERLLVCPGQPFKYGPAHDAMWVDVARRCAPCRLLFFRGDAPGLAERFERRLRAAFGRAGLDFDAHVLLLPWQPQAMFFGWLAAADVVLDSAGFSGFNTVMQAVECGAPVVTLEGRAMRSRFGAAVLRRLGLEAWVASDAAGYAERVLRLCASPALRDHVKAQVVAGAPAVFDDRAASQAWVDLLERLVAAPAPA